MADSRLYVHVVLDRSGSMESCRDQTIDAFNSYVTALAAQSEAGTRLSLTTFDSESIDDVVSSARIGEVPKLNRETFVPRASTPLLDAIAHVVGVLDKVTPLPGERVALAILTDGHENASREMTAEAIAAMLLDRQERSGWLVQYLGANQNAWSVGRSIGIAAGNALDFDTGRVDQAMGAMASSANRFRQAVSMAKAREAAVFTTKERAEAKSGGGGTSRA